MSIVSSARHGNNDQITTSRSNYHRPEVQRVPKSASNADEFDDDFLLDEEAENSLVQIEEIFQQTQQQQNRLRAESQTQVLSQAPYSQASYNGSGSKRLRSPQHDDVEHDRLKHARRLVQSVAAEVDDENDRIVELTKLLAEKAAEADKYKRQMYAKDGEVKLLRGNINNTISQYTSMLREREEAISVHKLAADQFKQANETLVSENRTLKSFRAIEANTNTSNHLWSSVSASVSRRRAQAAAKRDGVATTSGGGVAFSGRNLSQSHSQSHAASVGLTTPTKRIGGTSGRNLGSPSTSPSSGRARGSADQPGTTVKKPSFPGFVNSFAKPFIVKETQINGAASRQRRDVSSVPDEEVFLDHTNGIASQSQAEQHSYLPQADVQMEESEGEARNDEEEAKTSERSNWWRDPDVRYLWAVKTYTQRQGFLASLILAHTGANTSSAAPAKESLIGKDRALSSRTTLHRLIHVSLPADCPSWLREEYDLAANSLLSTMSRGTPMDAEDRFANLKEKMPYENEDLIETERSSYDQLAQAEALDVIDQGVADVIEGVTTSLRFMMAIAYKVGDYERVSDVLELLRSIATHFSVVLQFILMPLDIPNARSDSFGDVDDSQVSQAQQDDSQPGNEARTQHDVAASLRRRHRQRLQLNADRIMLGCIDFACLPAEHYAGAAARHSTLNCRILSAVVGILEVMVLETVHNDDASLHCTYKLRTMIDRPGVLAALLDARRSAAEPIDRTLGVLTFLCQHENLWRIALACRPDKRLPQSRSAALAAVSSEDSILFEVLAKLLVDGRLAMNAEWLHRIHRSVVVFVSQLSLCHKDEAVPIILHSGPILAALVKCLQLDTDLVWNYESGLVPGQGEEQKLLGELSNAVDRICMDLHLMNRLFTAEGVDEQTLSRKLAKLENQLLLNGMRHHFIVALSRVAFTSEPSWMIDVLEDTKVDVKGRHSTSDDDEGDEGCDEAQDEDGKDKVTKADILSFKEACRASLNEANELATTLLEMVLSPDEIEGCWEAMAEDEEDDEPMEDGDIAEV